MEDSDFSTFYQLTVGYKEGERTTVYAVFPLEETRVFYNFPTWSESTDSDSCDCDSEYEHEEEWKPSIPCHVHQYARIDCPQCITSYDALRKRRYIDTKLHTYETIVLYQKHAWTCEPSEIEQYNAFLKERGIPLEKICFVEKSGDYTLA